MTLNKLNASREGSKLEQAARQALEALLDSDDGGGLRYTEVQAVAALREALAEQAEQEPVAWKDLTYGNLHHQDFGNSTPLYAAPVRSKDLTDDEITNAWESMGRGFGKYTEFARAIITADREKNRG